jgi:hypothetical protein
MENKKEIDIISLIVWILNFVKRYFLVFVIFAALGIGGGLASFYLGRNYYNTKIIASSPVINNQIVYELVEPIKYYIKKEMYDSVAIKLNITVEAAKDIKSMEMDTTVDQAVVINMQVYGKENTAVIQDGLIYYINEIPYVKNTIEGKRKELEKYLKDLNTEISELNKLQTAILKQAESNQNINISIDNIFNEMMLLYDRKLLLQAEYNSLQSFKAINNSMIFDVEKTLTKSLVVNTFIGLLLGLILATILEIRQKVKLLVK